MTRQRDAASLTGGYHADAAAYRFLSYYFELRCESADVAAAAGRLLAPFAVEVDPRERRSPPTPGLPASYEVVAADGASYDLRYCERRMLRGVAGDVALGHLLWHVNAEAARQTGDFLLIHAGAAVRPSRRPGRSRRRRRTRRASARPPPATLRRRPTGSPARPAARRSPRDAEPPAPRGGGRVTEKNPTNPLT